MVTQVSKLLLVTAILLQAATVFPQIGESIPGITYSNHIVPKVPWSIHIVRIERKPWFKLHSTHAGGNAIGVSPVSAQVGLLDPAFGTPVAAINGDFYQRDKAFAGQPRGLQIVEGEVIGAQRGGVSFWVDPYGEPQVTNVAMLFQVTWPDGSSNQFGINGERNPDGVQLYTPTLGSAARSSGGREFVPGRKPASPWIPLRMGRTYTAAIREQHEGGQAKLSTNTLVLSVGPALLPKLQNLTIGSLVKLSTTASPNMQAVKTAISGGPVLLRSGKKQKMSSVNLDSYEFGSMLERHPRSGLGWNRNYFFLVEVDGRQKDLSVGMSLDEFADYLKKLGCDEAINFDGGGSATLWYAGKVQNSPCDKFERPVANALIVLRKSSETATPDATTQNN